MAVASILVGAVAAPPCAGCGGARGPLCWRCARKVGPPLAGEPPARCDRIVAAWEYEGPARALVLALKLRGRRPAAAPLAAALARRALAEGLLGDALTWVPARRADIRRRGYDHAEVLAREAARRLGLPARPLLARVCARPDQSSLGAAERRHNLEGAFASRPWSGRIILVDDLVTTGATAAACARALRAAGAKGVEVLAACRKS